ncbi:MAG: histidinol-phosphatase [Ignavibacterium album]|jgi:myo-inositol-1(or 4)-monophosphatase|uniref:histidinol-phosphatase n=1 Tax=Ignavibacterium album TaxID=591197 RepID=UPI0026E95D82|nr:histidinol-phosphatase [Ignavibacterium album]MCX8105707.1 histidinol-phosphatase [Ignavibacterium album]
MDFLKEFQPFCKLLADKSAEIIRQNFRKSIEVEQKSDLSPVTIADKQSEEIMRDLIQKEFPNHGIIGEEFGEEKPEADFVWILDPIDGTKSFICGALSFGTLIALTYKNQPVLGVINHPILNEFLIGDNKICLLNDVQVKVREKNNLSEAVLLTTDHLNIKKYQNSEKFERLINSVWLYRNWGDCYGYYLLATGFADIMIDPIMSVWDTMALLPIVNGAGGIITDYHGHDATKGNSIIAATPKLHSKVIELLN